ncbi:general secretion pathway protein A [Vibrio variabilis]|uniref:General secretion pathway protein A n=1 Tax=Vibrio variabilis TaxID=990271 RepID=A0ABQ0JDG6_9VIBR|nr:general secretion pathway protein A [Vibrio variabilis]
MSNCAFLTNLETDDRKLLKVLLIGQPELQQKLRTTQLRQLAQRITGRYHLLPLSEGEARQYIEFRLSTAGGETSLFNKSAVAAINNASQGIPRLINLIGDKALQYAYHSGEKRVSKSIALKACEDILSFQAPGVGNAAKSTSSSWRQAIGQYALPAVLGVCVAAGLYWKGADALSWVQHSWASLQATDAPNETATVETQVDSLAVIAEESKPQQTLYPAELIPQLLNRDDKIAAIQELYAVWGYRASVLDGMCDSETNGLFQCQKYLGTLEQITAQTSLLLCLCIIKGEKAMSCSTEWQVMRLRCSMYSTYCHAESVVESLWTGEYYSIWQREIYSTLRLNQQGEQVLLLDSKLSQVLGDQPTGSDVFDKTLERKVEIFQRWQNMDVDGIAGRNTLRQLELMTQTDAPSLVWNNPEEALQ